MPPSRCRVRQPRSPGSSGRSPLGVRFIGIAAAIGLVLFFIGAVAAHVRARVFYNIAFPGAFLALAVASLVLAAV
jgi:hypothetical protein